MSSKDGMGDGAEPRGGRPPHDEDENKVVRLPRDWLGPRDELVPFGPSAERDEPQAHEFDEGPPSPPADPVSPDDFWGERSAALQGPLDQADQETSAVSAAKSHPRRARAIAAAAAAAAGSRPRRARAIAAAAAAGAAVVILVLSLLGQSPNPGKPRASVGINRGGGHAALWPLLPHAGHREHHAGGAGHRRTPLKRPRHPRSGGAVAVKYVSQPSSAPSANSGGGGGGTTSPATPPPSPTPSSTTPPTPAATTPSTPTSSSGGSRPRKTAPFGPNGALGPGHSPSG